MRIFFSFNGRLDRHTYRVCRSIWYFANVLAFYALWQALVHAGHAHQYGAAGMWASLMLVLLVIGYWNTLAMQVKRWHDRDKSGFWVLISLVPVVGPVWSLVELLWLEGTPGYNRFDDLAKTTAATFA